MMTSAAQEFDALCCATSQQEILRHHLQLCTLLDLTPSVFPLFYPRLKSSVCTWRAQALWTTLDKRAGDALYGGGHACADTKLLVIGAGPCGLRAAIEAQLLGAKVVVIEKRDHLSRHNVMHLWPFVIHDLKALGAKKFFGKFCTGSTNHISIRQLQCILLKVALLLGVEFHEGVSYVSLVAPPEDQSAAKTGWRAQVLPADHPVSQYQFDVLIGAHGKRNALSDFKRKVFRAKLAIAVTANFVNRRTEAEACVEEISGVTFCHNQEFFKKLYQKTGVDLENLVYYKGETHYFVMTAKKHSLISKGVILKDSADAMKLLAADNKNQDALMTYARDVAEFATAYTIRDLEFAEDHHGRPDVAMFDFTSMSKAKNASHCVERRGHKLLEMLVGDSLLEPFWPKGTGGACGFLSALDACWTMRSWASRPARMLEVIAQRESIYLLLGQTTQDSLQPDCAAYTLDPRTRYVNLDMCSVRPGQVQHLVDTDDPSSCQVPPRDNQALAALGSSGKRKAKHQDDVQSSGSPRRRTSGTPNKGTRRRFSSPRTTPSEIDRQSTANRRRSCTVTSFADVHSSGLPNRRKSYISKMRYKEIRRKFSTSSPRTTPSEIDCQSTGTANRRQSCNSITSVADIIQGFTLSSQQTTAAMTNLASQSRRLSCNSGQSVAERRKVFSPLAD